MTPDQTPDQTLEADLAAVQRHTARLVEHAAELSDVRAPSLCEGWSRAHILTHVARNAEAIQRLALWALDGEARPMYPGGTESRDADIEAGASRPGPSQAGDPRPAGAFVDDLATTAAALDPVLAQLRGELAAREVEMRGGMVVDSRSLPLLRLREVVYHHVDLDAGFSFADVEPDLLHRFLDDAVGRLGAGSHPPGLELSTAEGDRWLVGDGAVSVDGSRAALLLWLARRDPSGLTAGRDLPDLPRGA